MRTVNMHDAKSQLSRLVEAVESGAETEVIIARNGRPAARLTAVQPDTSKRIGGAKALFGAVMEGVSLGKFNEGDDDIAELFLRGDE